MSAPKQYQALLSRWCAERLPGSARQTLQISYLIQGDQITIAARRPPTYPELDSAWSATPIAQLRYNDPEKGLWRIYLPDRRDASAESRWERYDHPPAPEPEPLLAEIAADPHSVFWG